MDELCPRAPAVHKPFPLGGRDQARGREATPIAGSWLAVGLSALPPSVRLRSLPGNDSAQTTWCRPRPGPSRRNASAARSPCRPTAPPAPVSPRARAVGDAAERAPRARPRGGHAPRSPPWLCRGATGADWGSRLGAPRMRPGAARATLFRATPLEARGATSSRRCWRWRPGSERPARWRDADRLRHVEEGINDA